MAMVNMFTLITHTMKVTGRQDESKGRVFSLTQTLNLVSLRDLKDCLSMMKWLALIGKRK